MSLLPARNILDGTATPTTSTIKTALGQLRDFLNEKLGNDGAISSVGFKNRLINAAGLINQRGVSGTVTLAAGVYGHDRFKAGASGCTYTFATSGNLTTFTISAGSLVQVIEGLNLETGTYILSWSGTAQGKSAGGAFSASGVSASITGGTNTTIEFSTGSLAAPQVERGNTATGFDYRAYAVEEMLCQRYLPSYITSGGFFQIVPAPGRILNSNTALFLFTYKVRARVPPTGLIATAVSNFFVSASTGGSSLTAMTHGTSGIDATTIQVTTSDATFTAGQSAHLVSNPSQYILFTGCEL